MDIRRRTLLSETLHEGGSNEGQININNYLTIEACENRLTAKLSTNACEYCVDGDGNWKSLAAGTATESINTGQTLSFRGNLTPKSSNGIGAFTISKKCNLKGNCMSMLFADNAANNYSLSGKNYAFCNLFNECTTIIRVSESFIPATTLATNCYNYMFYNCTNLTAAPELPATTLATDCYQYMFKGCTSLTAAPALPATTLAWHCYYSMFDGCSKLNYIKMLAADISASSCLYNWVNGVSSTGTFVKHPDMTTLTTGTSGIPSGWTVVNDGEESGLTFPVTLVEGDNGQLGIDLFNYLIDKYDEQVSFNEHSITEQITINSTTGNYYNGDVVNILTQLNALQETPTWIWLATPTVLNQGVYWFNRNYFILRNNGYLEYYND